MRPLRAYPVTPNVMESFRRQLSETVPGPIREAEDLLDLPPDILDDILTELGIEDACEAMRLLDEEP